MVQILYIPLYSEITLTKFIKTKFHKYKTLFSICLPVITISNPDHIHQNKICDTTIVNSSHFLYQTTVVPYNRALQL